MFSVKIVAKNPLLWLEKCMEIIRLLTKMRQIWPPSALGKLPDFKSWCLSVCKVEEICNYFRIRTWSSNKSNEACDAYQVSVLRFACNFYI